MKCPLCGEQITDVSSPCPECGNMVVIPAEPKSAPVPKKDIMAKIRSQVIKAPAKKKGRK